MRRTAGDLLGFPADARLVLVNCDDLGLAPEANEAASAALRVGTATSATLIVPASHGESAARDAAGLPIGIHLALNCELESDRWRPLTDAPSLCDDDGSLSRSPARTRDRADAGEVRDELRAQIERAMAWGIDPTHLDSHMYVLQERVDLFEVYLGLARDYALPVRVSSSIARGEGPLGALARRDAVVCPDHLVPLGQVGSRPALLRALADLPPGLSEFHLHPALDTPGLRSLMPDWAGRVDDAALLADPGFWAAFDRCGATLVGYRDLRDAARAAG